MKSPNSFTLASITGILCFVSFAVQAQKFKPCIDTLDTYGRTISVKQENFCNRVPAYKQCLEHQMNGVNFSLATNSLAKIMGSPIQYVCDNRGSFEELFTGDTFECIFYTKYPEVQRCEVDSFPDYQFNATLSSPFIGTLNRLSYTYNSVCRNFENYRRCSINVLKLECQNPNAADVFDDLLNIIEKELPCDVKSVAAAVPLAHLYTVLSAATAIITYLKFI